MAVEWYVKRGDDEKGPFSSGQLKHLAHTGQITPETMIKRGIDARWTQAGRVEGLFESRALKPVAVVPAVRNPVSTPPLPNAPPQVMVPPAIPIAAVAQPVAFQSQPVQAAPMVRYCPFCGEAIAISAIKCRFCNEFLDGRPREQPQPQYIPQPMYSAPAQQPIVNVVQQVHVGGHDRQRWSPVVAMLLSFIFPGLGQMYKGQPFNGLAWMIIVIIGYVAFVVPGLVLHLCCVLGAAMGDPYR